MRCVVQRVKEAAVTVAGEVTGKIGPGLMILIGVREDDTEKDLRYMAEKAPHLRIFEDEAGKMNRSVLDIGGAILAVSQFTLYGDARGGRRPSFIEAAAPRRPTPSTSAWWRAGAPRGSMWRRDASARTWRFPWSMTAR